MVISIGLVSLCLFLFLFIRFWIQKPSVKDLAKQIESVNPDLMDLLNCAVELEQDSKKRELSFMERESYKRLKKKVQEILWAEGTRPKSSFWVCCCWLGHWFKPTRNNN